VGIDLPGTEATVIADLIDDDSARHAVADAAERLGGLDALIGAAGVADTIHRAETFPLKEFRGDIEANLVAQFTVAQAAFPVLRDGRRPSVVLFSSVAAQTGLPGQAGYASAKAGVLGLTRSLPAEWGGAGIGVNAVVPGLVATPKVLGMPAAVRLTWADRIARRWQITSLLPPRPRKQAAERREDRPVRRLISVRCASRERA
jgi:NAD(P)-dependent dehydrogenase (short-subunit alcohol dehydrogenase family)